MPYSEKFGNKTTLLFDFDNTLLLLDEEKFVKSYFSLAAQRFADKFSIEQFVDHMNQSTLIMASNKDGKKTNIERFLEDFEKRTGMVREDIFNRFIDFLAKGCGFVTDFTESNSFV